MKRSILFILSALLVAGANIESRADEGMWLPSTINKTRIKQMQQRGLKRSEAVSLSVNGFVNDLVQAFPLEYSVELKRLIDMEVENAIG